MAGIVMGGDAQRFSPVSMINACDGRFTRMVRSQGRGLQSRKSETKLLCSLNRIYHYCAWKNPPTQTHLTCKRKRKSVLAAFDDFSFVLDAKATETTSKEARAVSADEFKDCIIPDSTATLMPVLEPKHKIFISHSGAEKDFVEQLCVDLEQRHHNPFFDKRPDSLPKGEKFPSLIFQAAEQCWVAVLVLSKDFFIRSKWPMLELVACIEATKKNPQLKILPLFYKVSLKELRDESFERLCYLTWTEWRATDPSVHPFNWRNALQTIYSSNGILFDGQGAVPYRRRVVEAVCKLVPPNVKFDDSYVQGKERLCQVVSDHMEAGGYSCSARGAKILGVYEKRGQGKTTLCKCLCNHLNVEYGGKVCYVEFGSELSSLDLQKKVLKELTDLNDAVLSTITDRDQGWKVLRERVPRCKVFLALDNVRDDAVSREEALSYLSLVNAESMVVVTARSLDVLTDKLKICHSACVRVPDLTLDEAINLFLQVAAPGCSFSSFKEDEQCFIRKCVSRATVPGCNTLGTTFLPLKLKGFGAQMCIYMANPEKREEGLALLDLQCSNSFEVRDAVSRRLSLDNKQEGCRDREFPTTPEATQELIREIARDTVRLSETVAQMYSIIQYPPSVNGNQTSTELWQQIAKFTLERLFWLFVLWSFTGVSGN